MLMPKKVKHRKSHKRYARGTATSRTNVDFGSFGLKAMNSSWVSSRQIEAARRVLARYSRRGGKVWIRIFPDQPVTKKGNEIPMGGGKGSVDHFVANVLAGTVLLEIDGVPDTVAIEGLRLAGYKFPVKTRVVKRGEW